MVELSGCEMLSAGRIVIRSICRRNKEKNEISPRFANHSEKEKFELMRRLYGSEDLTILAP